MPPTVRSTATGALGLLLLPLLLVAPAGAASPITIRPKADPVSSTTVQLSGTVPGAPRGTRVVVQKRRTAYDNWVRAGLVKAKKDGVFSLVVPLSAAQTLTYRACSAARCSRPQRLAIRRVDAGLLPVTWPSQTTPVGDPVNPVDPNELGLYIGPDVPVITVTGKADPRAAGAIVQLQQLIAGRWVPTTGYDGPDSTPAYGPPAVQPDGTFTIDTHMQALGQRHAQLRLLTGGNALLRPSTSATFTTLSWQNYHLSTFPATGTYTTNALGELWNRAYDYRTEHLVSPTDSVSFDVGQQCAMVYVRPGLLPGTTATARMTGSVGIDGAQAWSGTLAPPSGRFMDVPSSSYSLDGKSAVTLTEAPVTGATTSNVWYDAYATCAF